MFYDYHTHTSFSDDSDTPMIAMLEGASFREILSLFVYDMFTADNRLMEISGSATWFLQQMTFGNPRIKGYLLLNAAYRSLSRPSSPPRAKASTVCPYLLFSFITVSSQYCYYRNSSGKYTNVFFALLFALLVQYVNDLFELKIEN